jgi:hypothetical protein
MILFSLSLSLIWPWVVEGATTQIWLWKVEGATVERGLICIGRGWLKERWAGLANLIVGVFVVIERDIQIVV